MGEADDNPEIGGDKAIFVIAYDIAVFQQVERQFQRFVLFHKSVFITRQT
ncbi:hypothetical protein HMPREF2533_03075 [Bacteroides fragilis]|nr:hypothetical protein HMPREF2530_03075 [Bacteroides fragilis]KXU43881.1 hypothetical protein HMPREF2533_03075 [Bacteroides fragilis]